MRRQAWCGAAMGALLLAMVLGAAVAAAGRPVDGATERAEIEKVVRASIGWADNKDKALLFASVAQDSNFFIFHPDSRNTIVGFEPFRAMVERFFMGDAFKATGYAIRDLRINLSSGGDVAWFSTILDDHGEWNGEPTAWIDARWTGVLEKRHGTWVICQMHFSFASDKMGEQGGD